MEQSPDFWTAVFEFLKTAPPSVMAFLPVLGTGYMLLLATKVRTSEAKHDAAPDSEKLDRILENIATLTEKVSHLEAIEQRVQSLAERLSRMEGKLDAK